MQQSPIHIPPATGFGPCLARIPPRPLPMDVMFPLLLNKAVTTFWPKAPHGAVWSNRLGLPARHKRINLALQGGGAHGAFTWGVLDELLGDERIVIEGIS